MSLTWSPIKTPDAIDPGYLTEYFKNGYKTFADKYLKKRLEYNDAYIGNIGYEVYINTPSGGYTSLGFTTNTSFTYNGTISEARTFMVKAAYSKFKDNMSSGITTLVAPTGEVSPTPSGNWKVELNGASTMTVKEYYDFLNTGAKPVKVTDNNYDVTSSAKINTPTCWNEENNEVSCSELVCENKYFVQYTVTYNGKTRSISRNLSAGC